MQKFKIKKKKTKEKGFTLVELLVAISIMGIIMVIALPQISNIQQNNKTTKYKKYAESMLSSGKLYTDAYTEDMFGNNKSGCVDIAYSDLKGKDLLKDIKINGDTCNTSNTFIRVRKSNDHYLYETSILCKDKNGKTVYEDTLGGVCGEGPDIAGPTISFDENGSDWTKGINLTTKILLYDDYGLLENAKIKYAWFLGDTIQGDWTEKNFKNKRYEGTTSSKLSVTVTVPQGATGEYKLKVVPVDVRDANGNWLTDTAVSNAFKLDNTRPTCSSNTGSTVWTAATRTINVYCTDNHSGCEKSTYSATYSTGTTTIDSITIKDAVGNTNTCPYNVYVDKEAPTTPTSGNIGTVSGSDANASIQTAAGGSAEVNNGSGFKEYRYLVTNTSTTPTDKSKFTTSLAFIRSCGTSYYGWAIAVDNVGNMSAVKALGHTSDAADVYDTNWSTCTKKCDTGYQYKYNTCALKGTLSQKCNEQTCCSSTVADSCGGWSWSSCTATCGGGTKYQYRSCTLKSAYDSSVSCPGSTTQTQKEGTSCGTDSCCSSSYTTVDYYGGWGACSATCGGGTQYRDVYLKSTVTGESCGKASYQDSGSCNPQSCVCNHVYGGSYNSTSGAYRNYWTTTAGGSYTYNNCTHSSSGGFHSISAGQTLHKGQCINCGYQASFTWCPCAYGSGEC